MNYELRISNYLVMSFLKPHEMIQYEKRLWKKAMDIVKEKGGMITITALSQLLSSLMRNHFDLS
ncbi:hypothetical protein Chro_5896 (plasmid) [Chroococcidiopsis thermalis PCC 7203]|uniref:Uncharacterized protein n=1 Tax=Chroococcidiopsis thermalis (strain PCC 7203) TaxID=251229 RepID=K9U9X9_CHRTP|nr:hypothetical protein Chro_5896 [Chroococcidiopsis thermalis PCC 7203]